MKHAQVMLTQITLIVAVVQKSFMVCVNPFGCDFYVFQILMHSLFCFHLFVDDCVAR